MAVIVLDGEHVVYRLSDAEGRLLYVGISNNLERRLAVHRRSAWWPEVDTTETTVYDDRTRALIAEEDAIRDETPRYNKALNPTWKRPPPNWGRGIYPRCRAEHRVDARGFLFSHDSATGWCAGTGHPPRAEV